MRKSFVSYQKPILGVVLALSVLARLGVSLYLGDEVVSLPGTADQVSYHNLALRVMDGHGFTFDEAWWPATPANQPTAHWSYLYTYFLVGIYSLFGPNPLIARLLQALIVGVLQPLLAFLLGRRVFNPAVGLVAAGITAFYTYFIYYSATLMTEPFYISGILASLYVSVWIVDRAADAGKGALARNTLAPSLLLGVCLAVTVLLRQLFLLFIPFLLVWIWWANRKNNGQSLVLPLGAAVGVVIASILPFTFFNASRFDRFVLLNTNAGFAFFWANHPIYGTHFEPILPPEMGTYQDLIPKDLRTLDEAGLDQALLKRGLQFVLEDPGRYVLLSISRIPPYFMFWPSPNSGSLSNLARVTSFGILWPFMLYGLFLAFTGRRDGFPGLSPPVLLLLLFALVYTTIHVLTWTLIRYRLPVDAVLILFAGLALWNLIGRFNLLPQRLTESHAP